jgi:hypothetical protein
MLKIIAMIGSRKTPENILIEVEKIAIWARANKIYVRSGHAPGFDQFAEKGAMEYCIAYLPWPTFEEKQHGLGGRYKTPDDWTQLMAHASRFHPTWDKLSQAVRKLMARNSAQVLGLNLNLPVDIVICYTTDGGPSGGSGQAIRIANANKIPVWNMHNPVYNTAEKVISYLSPLLEK